MKNTPLQLQNKTKQVNQNAPSVNKRNIIKLVISYKTLFK